MDMNKDGNNDGFWGSIFKALRRIRGKYQLIGYLSALMLLSLGLALSGLVSEPVRDIIALAVVNQLFIILIFIVFIDRTDKK